MSNITEKLERNLRTAASLLHYISCSDEERKTHFLSSKQNQQGQNLITALALFEKLYKFLKNAEGGIEGEIYDGDEDDQVEKAKKKKKKTVGIKKKASQAIKLQGDKNGTKADKLQFIVRDVVFYIVNDYGLNLSDCLRNSDSDPSITNFTNMFLTFRNLGQPLVTRSVKVTVAEQTILVNKIQSRVKMERVKDNLNKDVEQLKTAQMKMVEEKEKEGLELKESIEESKNECRERLEQIMRKTENSIKQMEWESNKNQIMMKDKILELLGSKKELCSKHWSSERESRHKNLQLETQVKELLNKYDEEMFELHQKIADLENKSDFVILFLVIHKIFYRFNSEKAELDKVEERLAIIDGEKQIIVEEQRQEEARIRNAKLEEIRQRRAAITLQRAWRQYKVLQQQSKKKKKGKKK